MESAMKKGSSTESQGSLGGSTGNLGLKGSASVSTLHHVDVSTQADIVPELAPCYESEDETMGRRNKVASDLHLQRNKRGTRLYSKDDFREHYCITSKQLDVLERARGSGLFGCLSNYHKLLTTYPRTASHMPEDNKTGNDSSCRSRNSLLSVCVKRKVPSDENLHELCRRPAAVYAPLPRWPRYPPPAPPPPDICHYDDDLEWSYFRRRPRILCNAAAATTDPKRFTWLSEDEEATRMERPRSILDGDYDGILRYPRRPGSCLARYPTHSHYLSYSTEFLAGPCPAHPDLPPPPPPPPMPHLHEAPPPHRTKHVSFARSHTLTSFDDAVSGKPLVVARSQERLIGKKSMGEQQQQAGSALSESPKVVIMEKVKRAPMKTQATQTEVCLGRKPLAPNYLSLSPRTIHRVRMVSQGAQTNGNNTTRRLMKSYSEAGERFGVVSSGGVGAGYPYHYPMDTYDDMRRGSEHEPLHRTQSEEPPRSPFLVTTPPESLTNISQIQASKTNGPSAVTDTLQTPAQQTEPAKKKSSKTYKEIFIDFEPQGLERRGKKRVLQKTMSEGEILLDGHRGTSYNSSMDVDLLPDTGPEGPEGETDLQADSDYGSYYPHHMEDHEGYMEPLEKRSSSLFSSTPADLETGGTSPPLAEDQQDDEFHENLIYRGLFRKRSVSLEDTVVSSTTSDPDMAMFQQQRVAAVGTSTGPEDEEEDVDEISEARSAPPVVQHDRGEFSEEDADAMEQEEAVPEKTEDHVGPQALEKTDKDADLLPPTTPLTQPSSLFASSDSLANDLRDHSDGIWNESQATDTKHFDITPNTLTMHAGTFATMQVLQVADADISALSGAELSSLSAAGPGTVLALTPSSRRKQLLLLQHQQRSSMDTEALDEELEAEFDAQVPQAPPSPRICIEAIASLRPSPSATLTPNQEVPQMQENLTGIRRWPSPSPERLDNGIPVSPCPRDRVLTPSPSHPRRELRRRKSPIPGSHTPDSSRDSTQQHSSSLESTEGTTRGFGPSVPDLLLLARTDSGGKTGTDLSETSTCTTEDYVTANDTNNSGTDTSSRRSLHHGVGVPSVGGTGGSVGAGDGSSFESASSIYSLAREMTEDLIQVSCSPPPIQEESDLPTTPQLESEDNQTSTTPRVSIDMTAAQQQLMVSAGHKDGATSPSGESSSSSGSYSVEGSADEVEAKEVTSPPHSPVQKPVKTAPSGSDDEERSAHYSSSGYYESPADEEEGYGSAGDRVPSGERREWTEEEKRRRKKGFKLDFPPMMDRERAESPSPAGKHTEVETWNRQSSGKSEHSSKEELKRWGEKKATSPGNECKDKERSTSGRRTKSRSRSPVQHHKRTSSSTVATTPGTVQPSTKKAHRDKADKEAITPGMVRSPAMHEGFRAEDWGTLQRTTTPSHTPEDGTLLGSVTVTPAPAGSGGGGTSDDSSCGAGSGRPASETGNTTPTQQQQSPRRHRRVRESPRRKVAPGGGRSPTTTQQRLRRRSGSGEEKGLSSAATLARRRSSIPAKSPLTQQAPMGGLGGDDASRSSHLSPHRYSRSPGGSPSRSKHRSRGSPKQMAASSDTTINKAQGAMSPESSRLKALSAESLRSVSPGSDSVFYSEGADHSSNTTTLCHHCGREVDKNATLSGLEDGEPGGGETIEPEPPDIVQPPAGFADSPEGPRHKAVSSGRLFKKLEKRYRSEERGCHGERRHHTRYRCDGARAKSEERGREDRIKPRPLARSTDASMEMLRAADSSPSVMVHDTSLPDLAAVDGEEEDTGVYAESYKNATWIYIGDSEEMHVWQKPETKGEEKEDKSGDWGEDNDPQTGSARRDSAESTGSEKDFRRKYQAITHRMVHRKSSVEMYKRLASKSFDTHFRGSLRQALEDILKLMLHVWCKGAVAVKVVSAKPSECDKTVVVRRQSGEFGFRIHGSRPVVVSAIEPDTPAETSGLEVGDIIISVNNVNVLDASHSEVVKIAHAAGSDTLELEVARTCNVLTPVVREPGAGSPLYSGYLWKLGGLSNGAKWVQRWFCLKRDNCLYYYKNDIESQPLGAVMLMNYSVSRTPDSGRLYSFILDKTGATGLHLAADDEESAMRWLAVISHSIERNAQADHWLDISNRNLKLAASAVQQPDCFGYLMKLGHRWKAWKRRYCVLKDACLYFYQDSSSDGALGMACLHGYRVQNSTAGGKRFAFEILPPEPRQRHYYFHTDTEMDKKRWLAALEYSIDRWIKVG